MDESLSGRLLWYLKAQNSTSPNQNEKPVGKHNLEENNPFFKKIPSSYWKENIKCRDKRSFPLVSVSNKLMATVCLIFFTLHGMNNSGRPFCLILTWAFAMRVLP